MKRKQNIAQAGAAARRADGPGTKYNKALVGFVILLLVGNIGWYMTFQQALAVPDAQRAQQLTAYMTEFCTYADTYAQSGTDAAYYSAVSTLHGASAEAEALASHDKLAQTDAASLAALWQDMLAQPEAGKAALAPLVDAAAQIAAKWDDPAAYEAQRGAAPMVTAP